MKSHNIFILLIGLLLLSIIPSVLSFDESNEKGEQTKFVITQDAINVQKDETQLEQQRLEKEAEFNLKKSIKEDYLNEMWATYSATIILIVDLVIMFFLIVFVRLIFFILFELLPYGLNKLVDYIETWME
jgi:hypothetical protein